MTRSFAAAALVGIAALVVPSAAQAQHTAPAGSSSSGSAVPSGGSSSGSSSSGGSSAPSSGGSSDSGSSGRSFDSGRSSSGSGHQRGGATPTGTAVRRNGQPGGPVTIGGGFYPWGYVYGGGFGAGIYDGFYGGYYGSYDPWYGFAPVYAPSATSGHEESGAIRLKVKPSNASVYVDGYYVGVVDDFDGAFQRLHLEAGPHRLEIRAANYQPLSLDVWITEDMTITYEGDLHHP